MEAGKGEKDNEKGGGGGEREKGIWRSRTKGRGDGSKDRNGREESETRREHERTAIEPKPEVYLGYSDSLSCRYERAAHPRSFGFPSLGVGKIHGANFNNREIHAN